MSTSESSSPSYKRSVWAKLFVVLGLVFAALVSIVTTEFYQHLKGTVASRPYVAVVVSKESVDFPIPGEFLRGFQEAYSGGRNFIEARNGQKVDIRTLEDLGSVGASDCQEAV